MSLTKILKHLFIPHESNNQKAKIIHTKSLYVFAVLLVGFQLLLNVSGKAFPSVLGYAANISPAEVINLTNQERASNGLMPLKENSVLSSAALAKGQDMLAKGYWAHFAPDGTSPWSFFTSFGYKYQYAGENLARDFTNAGSAVAAWMNSPTHKENILNSHYREIGIGVVDGSLNGTETTIIVQFFGAPLGGVPSIPIAKAQDIPSPVPSTASGSTLAQITPVISEPISSPTPLVAPVILQTKISPFKSTKNISVGVIGILLLVLSIDLIIVKRNKIARIGGRTLAHIAYLSMILAVILLLKAGQII
jgi:uncharacterized protein YkwD